MKDKLFLKVLAFALLPLIFSGCRNSTQYDYNDNKIIASENNYSAKSISISPLTNGKINGEIGKLEGCKNILEANIQQDTEVTLHIQFTANSGKGKLVLVKPNSEVEILEEVTSENNYFEGDVSAKCISGTNKIKIVGENYSGNIEIYQPKEVVFYNIEKVKNKDKKSNGNDNDDMFGDNFPFEKGDV